MKRKYFLIMGLVSGLWTVGIEAREYSEVTDDVPKVTTDKRYGDPGTHDRRFQNHPLYG